MARTGSWLACSGDKTAGCALGPVGLLRTGSLVRAAGQGAKGGRADGYVQ